MKVQVNRCVVETQRVDNGDNCSLTDWRNIGVPTTLKVEQQVASEVEQVINDTDVSDDDGDDADGRVQVTRTLPDVTNAVQKSPLTYVELFVENQGPYRCLVGLWK